MSRPPTRPIARPPIQLILRLPIRLMLRLPIRRDPTAVDGDDDDSTDTDSDELGAVAGVSSVGASQAGSGTTASGTGQLPTTGGDASSIALIGGFAIAVGGLMYQVSTRRVGATLARRGGK